MQPAPIRYDAKAFAQHFEKQPFRLQHQLVDHPLFEMERLVQLATNLPANKVEWNAGHIDAVMAKGPGPSNGLDATETLRRIEECGSWMVLKHVELDPEYRALLEACVQSFRADLEKQGQAAFHQCGFLFVSSPGAVTPFHLDPEVNFLLQIRGHKTMTLFDRQDRCVVSEMEREVFAAGGHRNLSMDQADPSRSQSFTLHPGDALHVPFHAPHSVRNGDAVSVSFSVTFQTEASDAEHGVLWMNRHLRRLGWNPQPFRGLRGANRAKYAVFKSMRAVKRLF